MQSATDFQHLATLELERLAHAIENADEDGQLEVDWENGVLCLSLPDGRQYMLHPHHASRQLWVASPVRGGLHFSLNAAEGKWRLADGQELWHILAEELQLEAGIALQNA